MSAWSEIRERLRSLLRREEEDRAVAEEMSFHLEMETESNLRRGMSPAEARRRARLSFGGVDRYREQVRDARGVRPLEDLARDLRFALRSLRSAPTFAAVAVTTLALAVGATTSVFSVVDGVLLRPLDFHAPDRIVRLLEYDADGERGWGTISQPNFVDWVGRTAIFQSAALYDEYRPHLGEEAPERVHGASVGAAYFEVLGVEPALGRFFLPEEDEPGSSRVVLSWGLWQERFGADADVIGSTIRLNGFPYTVVGVAPRGLEDPGLQGASFGEPRLWRSTPGYFPTNGRGSRSFTAIARLREGVSPEQARLALNAVHAELAEEHPEANAGKVVEVVPLKEDLVGSIRPALLALLAGVGLILLIACANVANLLLFRASAREREISLRAALGARRGRIVQQLLSESFVLAVLGGALGVGLAYVATRGLIALGGDEIPRLDRVSVDGRVMGFAAAVMTLTTFLFGVAPALHATRLELSETLSSGGRGSTGRRGSRLRTGLVAAEAALAVVVVASGGLLARSLLELRAVDPGMRVERLLVMEVDPPFDPYFSDEADTLGLRVETLYTQLLDRVRQVRGVQGAGMIDILPLSGSFNGLPYRLASAPAPSSPAEERDTELRAVVPGYFEAMRIPLRRGRPIRLSDQGDSPPVAIVNETLARRHWPGGDAVGEEIVLGEGSPVEIVGVVGDVTEFRLDAPPEPTVYVPNAQAPGWMRDEQKLVIRTAGDPETAAAEVRAVIREVDPRLAISDVRAMESVLGNTLARERFRTLLVIAFAVVALLLAAVGVYGMVAFEVTRRTRELGIRLALGASTRRVSATVLERGLRPVVLGAGIGVAGAWLAGRALAGFLFGVSPADPVTFFAVPLGLLAIAALAAWLPARRAARVAVVEVLAE